MYTTPLNSSKSLSLESYDVELLDNPIFLKFETSNRSELIKEEPNLR
jgi:hypothetical protein